MNNSILTIGYDPANSLSMTSSSIHIHRSSISSLSTTTGVVNNNNSWSSGAIYMQDDVSDFCEFVLDIIGVDLKYDDFCKMSKAERKSLLREIKIKRVLD